MAPEVQWIDNLIRDVIESTTITRGDILGNSRQADIVKARHEVYIRAYNLGFSMNKIAKILNRDHTTVRTVILKKKAKAAETKQINVKYCPNCEGETRVIDSKSEKTVIRRRECLECGNRMTTIELPTNWNEGEDNV